MAILSPNYKAREKTPKVLSVQSIDEVRKQPKDTPPKTLISVCLQLQAPKVVQKTKATNYSIL